MKTLILLFLGLALAACSSSPSVVVDKDRIYELRELSKLPETKGVLAQPVYPQALKLAGVSGDTLIEIVISAEGDVIDSKVVKASDPSFGEAGLYAVSKWKFIPAKLSGVSVKCRLQQPLSFKVTDH